MKPTELREERTRPLVLRVARDLPLDQLKAIEGMRVLEVCGGTMACCIVAVREEDLDRVSPEELLVGVTVEAAHVIHNLVQAITEQKE